MNDVIIIGGSYAGLAAALQLGRARRRVLVLDAAERRNRFAASSHGFLGSDGRPPDEIAARGRADVSAYPTVTVRDGRVTEVRAIEGGFAAWTGGEHRGRRIILATGVADELPAIPGVAERWGRSVFHCPYCHGYELDMGAIGVLASSPLSMHQALLASEWAAPGQTTFFLDAAFEPEPEQLAELAARRIQIERERVAAAAGEPPGIEIHLADGRAVRLAGLFVAPRQVLVDRFAEQLGCELEMGPSGPYYRTDATKETTVPGVFACGDAALPAPAVALAVADGTRAGMAAHRSLVFPPGTHPAGAAAAGVR